MFLHPKDRDIALLKAMIESRTVSKLITLGKTAVAYEPEKVQRINGLLTQFKRQWGMPPEILEPYVMSARTANCYIKTQEGRVPILRCRSALKDIAEEILHLVIAGGEDQDTEQP